MTNEEKLLRAQLDDVEKSQRQLKEAVQKLEHERMLGEYRKLYPIAQRAHELCCRFNHTDGCGWFYEVTEDEDATWSRSDHKNWIFKIERAKKKFSDEEIIDILNATLDYKKALPKAAVRMVSIEGIFS